MIISLLMVHSPYKNEFLKRSISKPIIPPIKKQTKNIPTAFTIMINNIFPNKKKLTLFYGICCSIIVTSIVTYFISSRRTLCIDYKKLSRFSLSFMHDQIQKLEEKDPLFEFKNKYWQIEKKGRKYQLPIFAREIVDSNIKINKFCIETEIILERVQNFIEKEKINISSQNSIEYYYPILRDLEDFIFSQYKEKYKIQSPVSFYFNHDYILILCRFYFQCLDIIKTIKNLTVRSGIKFRSDLFQSIHTTSTTYILDNIFKQEPKSKNLPSFVECIRNDMQYLLFRVNVIWYEFIGEKKL